MREELDLLKMVTTLLIFTILIITNIPLLLPIITVLLLLHLNLAINFLSLSDG